jgi:TonB family protein
LEFGIDENVTAKRREESREPFPVDRLLACADSGGAGRGRRGLVASAAIHALLVAGVIALPVRLPRKSEEPLRVDVVFYPEPAPLVEPAPLPAAFEAEIDPPTEPEPRPIAPPPAIERPAIVHDRRPPPRPAEKEVPSPAPAVIPVQPLPAKPVPEVRPDVFESERSSPPTGATPRPRPETRTSVFEEARARAATPVREVAVARTGAFASDPPPGAAERPRPVVLATTEVGAFEVESPSPARSTPSGPPPGGRTVVDAGFGEARASGDTAETGSPAAAVQQGGFAEAVVVAEPRRPSPKPAANPDVPVEIVSKPRPAYTEQARELRVEGEVVLEVLFGASGRLRVIRVVQGLGHGLDDAAVEAARRIDFKPALRNGKPIDYVATLRVVFQLA